MNYNRGYHNALTKAVERIYTNNMTKEMIQHQVTDILLVCVISTN